MRQESEGDQRGALRGFRWVVEHGRGVGGIDTRVAATGGAYRALQAMHSRAPAAAREGLQAELDEARTAALRALLGRGGLYREWGRLAEAQRDFRSVVDERAGTLSGDAAHQLAEMIDDARGNRRHDRYPVTAHDRGQPRRIHTPAVGPDSAANLRALGYATEADARTAAIRLCLTALRHPTALFERHGVSALLAQLLEDDGDAAGATAAHAHREIPLLLDAALSAADHNYAHSRAQQFAPYVIARLRHAETVEHLRWSTLSLPHPPGSYWTGYLLRTGERLLFLEDFFYPHLRDDDGQPPAYEVLAVDRAHARGTFSANEHGVIRWHLTFGTAADGTAARQGEVYVTLGKDAGPWREAIS
ncbi:hypothetical protein O7599_04845 [Streptomyces sp. WMMC500]|uniref:hypothetical protein n=1 Tax=Streptomyces sp. WMMC500 TaxID=3015154 RepID=UPI00248BF551|nr:hypothetical protein [Streptomyces sp. WMMC500]WBB61882.1 hypothetical protein O7599_04845 [Streptomyces sp. WMMC500]